jgi:hypothetical protein
MSGLWVRGSGADCWHYSMAARSVITWPRVCEGCPTYRLLCQPYTCRPFHVCCRRSKGSASACVEMELEESGCSRCGPRSSPFRALFTEGGPPARSLTPIVRMSAEQPRLALADLTEKLLESISRPPSAKAWLDSTPLAMEFFDLLASMVTAIAQTPAKDKQISWRAL